MNGRRVAALLRRQFDLMRTSPARVLPLFAWVAVDMVLWGYIARYVEAIARATHPLLPALLGAVLLWDFFTRVMQGVTMPFFEDVWSRNVFSTPRGSGSGFIWDGAGHVVTNFHVIAGASEAMVQLADGRKYRASLVGASPQHDLAVLRIGVSFRRPAPVPIGSSEDLKVGQKVFAIGNPFGLDWTLTTGIVSALDRSLPSENGGPDIEHLIQTDAAINPGNSGGPLLDSSGRLIGINTAIYSPSGASAGIGFAVPVDTVARVVPQLVKTGRYVRASLGVIADEQVNSRLEELTGRDGVFILEVQPGSAAAKALTGR